MNEHVLFRVPAHKVRDISIHTANTNTGHIYAVLKYLM
jgi:hypothetical protein